MLHKISQLCDKIDGLKQSADRLREMKYGPVKAPNSEIDHMIEQIQHECYMISQDKGKYESNDATDVSDDTC